MSPSVLFVCLGNICRSPLAAAILRKQAAELGASIKIDSVGTGGWHIGQGADARAVVAGRVHGFDLADHVARQLSEKDLDAFDLILVMDRENHGQVAKMASDAQMKKVAYVASFGTNPDDLDVPDPYYTGRFDPLIAKLEDCVAGILRQVTEEQ